MSGTVLIVDDDPNIREALTDLFQDEGYRVLVAREGAEALALLAHEHPCVILFDIMMPVMDGLTFLRHVRSSIPHRSIPIAIMTAVPSRLPKTIDVPLIRKPIEIHSLLDLVRQHCEPDSAATVDDEPGPPPGPGRGGLDCASPQVGPRLLLI
jgi:CheY-like chemotaxis protein